MAGDGRGPSLCFSRGCALPQLGRGTEHASPESGCFPSGPVDLWVSPVCTGYVGTESPMQSSALDLLSSLLAGSMLRHRLAKVLSKGICLVT